MKRPSVTVALLVAVFGLAAVGCGGGSGQVPADAVAVVDGTEIPRSELDALLAQGKRSYEAAKQEFPKVGTSQYQEIQQRYVAFLVQKAEYEHELDDLGLEVTEKDVDKAGADFLKSRFNGNEQKLNEALKQQGLTSEAYRDTLRVSVLSQKIFDAVTKDVTVTDTDLLAAYAQNKQNYGSPESREVRHILIAEKGSNGQVDFAKSESEADRVYAMLQDGADFVSLVRQFSADTGTKAQGGKYTAVKGQSVPAFDKVAFELKTDDISQPVRTRFGFHLIQATSDVKPAKVTGFAEIKDALRTSLLQERRNQKMTEWVQDLQKRYEGKVSYAAGLDPPAIPEPDDSATTETQ